MYLGAMATGNQSVVTNDITNILRTLIFPTLLKLALVNEIVTIAGYERTGMQQSYATREG
jgi:hypothetical protein